MSFESRAPAAAPALVRSRADRLAFLVALVAALLVKVGWLPIVPW